MPSEEKKKKLECKSSKELDLSEIPNQSSCYDVTTILVPTQSNIHSEPQYDPNELCALKDIKKFLKRAVGKGKEVFTLDTKSAEKLDEDETYYVEKIRLPWSKELSRICYLSKNLFNHAIWLTKMRYDFTCQPENLSWLEQLKQRIEKQHKNAIFTSFPALLRDFKEAQESLVEKIHTPSRRQGYYGHQNTLIEEFGQTKKHRYFANPDPTIYFQIGVYMYYPELWQLVRYGQHYNALGGQTAQQTLKKVTEAWASYSKLKAEWNKTHKGSCPHPPWYKPSDGEFMVTFTGQQLRTKRALEHFEKTKRQIEYKGTVYKKTAEILFPKKAKIKPIRTTIDIHDIAQVDILPRGEYYQIRVKYKKQIEDRGFDRNRAVALDIGVNNTVTFVNNFGEKLYVIRGKWLKSKNQLAWKTISTLRSKKFQSSKFSNYYGSQKLQERLCWGKRNNRVDDYIHKVSKILFRFCKHHRPGTLVIGYNKRWKYKVRLGDINNQNFVSVPFVQLMHKIYYKATALGIKVKFQREYNSSRTCCNCGRERKKNRHKGIYTCDGCGIEIHSDINGAINNGRLKYPELFSELPANKYLFSPRVINFRTDVASSGGFCLAR